MVSIPGYRTTEELYNGSRTLVYRGYRETDSLPVVIKLLKNPYPSFSELLSFRNQYTIAKNLNSELIVQTYSLEAYQNGYALVMEDFGGISLKDYFTSDQGRYIASGEEFLQIAIALCNTLDILYQERIIHKDIKPANILINPETKQVKLIDFSIASLLPRETQTLINPNVLEGTLTYISPEQTGRMNRGIDYRTDFYSLGVTFYELLTGELPFQSNDPMELVHSHIAKMPPALGNRELLIGNRELLIGNREEIPQILSDIVMKLMAKNAEERYQSALGLKFDLENCLSQLQVTGSIENFEIASRDVCDRLIIPDKLYGRETELSTLLQAFERVSLGATEMMLVAGFSGIGKTAVVNEVHKPILRQRGYFIKGKYDQFQRNIPFSAFVQAFRDLIGQLLSESDTQIQQWKNKMLSAVGENGQVIIEVIPELSIIIGEQPPAIELSGTSAQNRFNLLFQKFTQVFTSAEHPLVMFLDDLQWADSASLKLMQLLMADTNHLFIIGAYRDNEVNPGHPLMLTLGEIEKNQATINTITLAPLSQNQVNQLVAETLKCTESLAYSLSRLVSQKTQGNPFFVTQFLKALHQENFIQFTPPTPPYQGGGWQCDIAQVITLAVTDDVVAFMGFQLRKLPPSTQQVLQLAACIGNQFDLATLAIVSEQSEIETAAALWKALQEGLILPISNIYKFYIGQENQVVTQENQQTVTYKFLHDRVQQAAYSLISDDQKQMTHLKVGQLLLHNLSQEKQEEKIFDIVNHLNIGVELITIQKQRNQLAQLNLMAGKKALTSTAYAAAAKYFDNGVKSLGIDSWQSDYGLTLALYESAVVAEYLNINFAHAQTLANFVLEHTTSSLDRVKFYELQIKVYMAQSEMPKALSVGIFALELLGVDLSVSPVSSAIQLPTLAAIESLPVMLDAHQIAVMRILIAIFSPAYTTRPELLSEIVLTMIDLSLKQGHTSLSAFVYVFYGILLCGFEKDVDKGYYSGLLALKVLDRFSARELECKVNNLFNVFIRPWKEPLIDTIESLERASQIGFEMGDIEYASYATAHHCTHCVLAGQMLTEVQKRQNTALEILLPIKQNHSLSNARIWQQFVSNLLGDVTEPKQLSGKNFDETELLPAFCSGNDRSLPFTTYLAKCILSYLFGDYSAAVVSAVNAASYTDAAIGLTVAIHNFYYSLALLSQCIDLLKSEGDRPSAIKNHQSLLDQVEINQKFMKAWMVHAPTNFEHKYSLVSAEKCRVLGQKAEAIELYDKAIALAKANEYIQEEALANELAAKFYLEWGKQHIAQEYMTNAYYCYARWGAKAKVADLERRYPQLLAPILQQPRSLFSTRETIFALESVTSTSFASSSSSVSDVLDLKAILKAFQAISGEIELEKLLSSLLSIIIENAGADKCVLMLLRDSRLLIKGSIIEGSEPVVLQRLPIEESQDIPLKLIYKVLHNKETVVVLDAIADPTLANDPYIIRQQPKSILCSPILHQGKLMGILYLENNLATGAFTSDRVKLLNLLCAQAAISLENARLYERSLEYSQQLEQSLNELSAAQSRFHHLVDNVPGVVYQYRMSADGVISINYISTDCYNLLEITHEQAMSNWQFFNNSVHPDDIASYQQSATAAIQTRSSWHWSGRIVTPSGIIKWIHAESRIERLADGSVVWHGLFLDISEQQAALHERKLAELALQQKSLLLEQALNNLQNAQLQIVQSEKMSALGNLVAGVAHEINNPVGCIIGNVDAVQDSINDLFGLIDLYNDKFPQPGTEIEEELETIDLEYLRDDLPKLIRAMKDGGDRIKSISNSLRTFSRADSDQKQTFNLHEGIDSTILILRHRLKANETRPAIEVVTNYGNLPQVECFPGQLNQVFMNILANAIDALEESKSGLTFAEIEVNPNYITIQTSVENKKVKIVIADNGKGMSEEVKSRIFDHLFTTKAVGKGTGLGLAIARQIVEETHGGNLNCTSVLGQGTEFIITLPVETVALNS